ncbi:MAG: hypothetical protein CMJ78_26250 [Planctomycetaceae bacterium]|nr:hypothetical protein [Planctomycetaceae bacterium]
MSELGLSLVLVLLVSTGLFMVTVRLSETLSTAKRNAFAATVMFLGVAYHWLFRDGAAFEQLLSHANLIVLSNWIPIFAMILAGLVWTNTAILKWRRALSVFGLVVASLYSASSPVLGVAPQCEERWDGDVCMQTTPWTCSPASAATLLKAHGIPATEQEMAKLCLTRQGTRWMGLYRGLSLKTEGTGWRVELIHGSIETLRDNEPAILVAELPEDLPNRDEYRRTSGWIPGQQHAVVFIRFLDEDRLVVADPSFGRELWRTDELQTLWTGMAMRLVPRTPVLNSMRNQVAANLR